MGSTPEQGQLRDHPLPRLLLGLARARFGGALTLQRDRVGKRFLFHEGSPVFAESNLASESLGIQLMDAGRIDRAAFNRATAHIERTGTKEGAAFLELGILEPKELFVALKNQIRTRLLECFGWNQGEFFVDASSATPADAQPFRLDTLRVVQEGLETYWSGERIYGDLAERMDAFPSTAPAFANVSARLASDDAVQALYEALDGTRNLWKVIQSARSQRALAAIWVLDAMGALAYADAPASAEGPSAAAAPDVEIVLEGPRSSTVPLPRTGPADGAAPESSERPSAGPSGIDALRREIAAATADAAAREASEEKKGRKKSKKKAAPKPAASAAVEALRDEIDRRFAELDASERPDHYALLGVEPDVDAAAIKRAYLMAAKTYHPDALARLGLEPELRERAARVFAEIGKAHSVLSDPQARRAYDSTSRENTTDQDAERLAQAETLYRKGEILLRQGNFRGALEFLEPAATLWPEECAYQSALGWALFKKAPPEIERAREHLEMAARIDPDDAETLMRISVVLRELGEDEQAAAAAARAEDLGV